MTKRMLIDASHPEETRVVVLDGNRVEEFDLETATRKPLKGNIYLAKVVRVEPSLQAAFVEYGGNRHGFLAFGEIHPDYYQIPVADRQRLLEMQAEEARAEEEADLPPESAMDRAAWNGEDSEAWANGEEAAPAEQAAEGEPAAEAAPATEPEAAAEAEPVAEPEAAAEAEPVAEPEAAAEAAPTAEPEAAAAEGEPTAPSDAEPAAADEGTPVEAAPEAPAPAAKALDMADDRITGTPDAGMPVEAAAESAEDTHHEAGESEYLGRVESIPADEPPPPPETIGGEDLPAEAEEERRERRIPPRFLRQYKIQEVIKRRQIMLVQVVKEERGGKGAALTTYISLAGRFSVLMPNSPRGGGVSRKITSAADRKRLREVVEEMSLPDGMSLIVRTAGAQRPKPEIKRDCEYLLRLWDNIRERTLASTAPALIYEEADLIKRSIRDVFGRDIEEILVEGDDAYSQAREFMRMLMPANASKVRLHREAVPLFARYGVDQHLDAMHSPVVHLKSGGYIVINQTEALVAIDVNSGRATRDRHIEDTALRTNLEAADEIARQLRLRDLAGLIVIDFIDMESSKHDGMVERRMKEALKQDRARIQVGRISHFGLLEMSRQRLRPSIAEQTFHTCPHCQGRGIVRSVESSALQVLRAIEEEGAKRRASEIMVHCAAPVALWLLNRKRDRLAEIEARFGMAVMFEPDDELAAAGVKIERLRAAEPGHVPAAPSALRMDYAPEPAEPEEAEEAEATEEEEGEEAARPAGERAETAEEGERRRRRRRRRRGGRREDGREAQPGAEGEAEGEGEVESEGAEPEGETEGEAEAAAEAPPAEARPAEGEAEEAAGAPEGGLDADGRRRRRGRRGGRRRREEGAAPEAAEAEGEEAVAAAVPAPRPARYTGPTPADPFAGQIDDIFEALEAAEAAAERAATARPARAATTAAPEPAADVAEPVVAAPVVEAAEPVVTAPVAEVAEPVVTTPDAETAEPVATAPVAEVADPVLTAPPAATAAPAPAEPATAEAEPAPAAGEAPPAAAAPAEATPAAPQEPVVGAPVQPKVLGTGAEAELPKRQGWWRR